MEEIKNCPSVGLYALIAIGNSICVGYFRGNPEFCIQQRSKEFIFRYWYQMSFCNLFPSISVAESSDCETCS